MFEVMVRVEVGPILCVELGKYDTTPIFRGVPIIYYVICRRTTSGLVNLSGDTPLIATE